MISWLVECLLDGFAMAGRLLLISLSRLPWNPPGFAVSIFRWIRSGTASAERQRPFLLLSEGFEGNNLQFLF
jgi:hypothetical protein